MHVLFLCSKNKLRSPTAEAVFADHPGIETDSAGLNRDAGIRLSDEQIEWADLVLVMEPSHRRKLQQGRSHLLRRKRIIVLGIPDHYGFMDEKLVELLKRKCRSFF